MVVEMCDLFSSRKSKDEINKLIKFHKVKVTPKVSKSGILYSEVRGKYYDVMFFISKVYNMDCLDVILGMRSGVLWS